MKCEMEYAFIFYGVFLKLNFQNKDTPYDRENKIYNSISISEFKNL